MFALSVRSLGGSCCRLEVQAHATLPEILTELEQKLPPFHEIQLFQGERELVGSGAVVEVELTAVAKQSPSKALAVMEMFWDSVHKGATWKELLPSALNAAASLGEMQGELAASDSNRLFELITSAHKVHRVFPIDESHSMCVAFGRRCSEPASYVPLLLENIEDPGVPAALAEIVSRSEGQLSESSQSLTAWASEGIDSWLRGVEGQQIHGSWFNRKLQLAGCFKKQLAGLRLVGLLGDMSQEDRLTRIASEELTEQHSSFLQDPQVQELRDEATSALALIHARHQQHRNKMAQDFAHGENFADHGSGFLNDRAGAELADSVKDATEAVWHGSDDETKLEQNVPAEVLRESQQHADQQEGALLAEALLRSKIDMQDMQTASEVVLLRLTTYSDEVDAVLLKSPELAACRAAVLESGCELVPSWGNGAKMFVPVALNQLPDQELTALQVHHIIMRDSDKVHLQAALRSVCCKKRPKFRQVSFLQVADGNDSVDAADADIADRSDDLSDILEVVHTVGVMVQNTFVHYSTPKDCSETSVVLQSAPGGSGKEPTNPRRWAPSTKANANL